MYQNAAPISQANSDLSSLSNASFSNRQKNSDNSHSLSSWFKNWTARTIAYIAMLPSVAAVGSVFTTNTKLAADNIKDREVAVATFALDAWQGIKPTLNNAELRKNDLTISNKWNNIIAALYVSDNTALNGLDELRSTIIKLGAVDENIPADAVHAALYTSGVLADELTRQISENQKEILKLHDQENNSNTILQITRLEEINNQLSERRSSLAEGTLSYLNNCIVDKLDVNGNPIERTLVPVNQVNLLANSQQKFAVHNEKDFSLLAGILLGKTQRHDLLKLAAEQMLIEGIAQSRRDAFFKIFEMAPVGSVPQSVLDKSKEWVFGEKKTELNVSKEPKSSPGDSIFGGIFGDSLSLSSNKKTLAELTSIDSGLTKLVIKDPASMNSAEREFIASNILLLARHSQEGAKEAASQWFGFKKLSTTGTDSLQKADYMVLEALALCAQSDNVAYQVLERVAASFPELVLERSLVLGSASDSVSPASQAGQEVLKAFQKNRESVNKLLLAMANREAYTIWSDTTRKDNAEALAKLREYSRESALNCMIKLNHSQQFNNYFKKILDNPFSSERDVSTAITGIALSKDTSALEKFMSIASNPAYSENIRELALQAALFADTPHFTPEVIRQKVENNNPFIVNTIDLVINADQKSFNAEQHDLAYITSIHSMEGVNVFQNRIFNKFNAWLELKNRSVFTDSAQKSIENTPDQKLSMLFSIKNSELAGNGGALAALAKNQNFKEQYLMPLLEYIKKGAELGRTQAMSKTMLYLDVLSKAQVQEAESVLCDIIVNPEKYADQLSRTDNQIEISSSNAAYLKAVALENIGSTIDLYNINSDAVKALHRVLYKESAIAYRMSALHSLAMLGDRYTYALSTINDTELRDQLLTARKFHAQQALQHLVYHSASRETETQMRLFKLENEFNLASAVAKLGGVKELIELALSTANEAALNDRNLVTIGEIGSGTMRPSLIRSIMHALFANNFSLANIDELNLSSKDKAFAKTMFSFVNDQLYWVNTAEAKKYDARQIEAAVFDVGYVMPLAFLPALQKQVIYPENLVEWEDLNNSTNSHPTAVATTILKLAPEAKIRTYDVNADLQERPYRGDLVEDAMIQALEDLAQLQVAGLADVEVANYSIGFVNSILYNKPARENMLDLLGAYMELLSRLGVKHSISAGNSHGDAPGSARYEALGELNSLGMRYDKNGKPYKPDGVFIAGAYDGFSGDWLAEFTSKQDVLRATNPIDLVSYPGVSELLPWLMGNKWELTPIDGTSFSAPNQTSLLLRAVQAVRLAGKPNLTMDEWQELVLSSTKELSDREAAEGGKVISEQLFWTNLAILLNKK